ncbi:SDR family NAD(P)-dependent oxidoreductase [Alphaproteobacteria bacterium]|nr:SDR family NAD(P)-dependent oxidoreductase [Alphaproteobacteria bacterium]
MTNGWTVCGTVRTEEKAQRLRAQGINAFAFDASTAPALSGEVISALHQSTHILQSIGTAKSGNDPLLPLIQPLAPALQPQWAGYLSTTVVYGDWQGALVDESAPARSTSTRGLSRLSAEAAWAALGWPLHVFRLAGIYGPGRNALETVRGGRARIIDKPEQVFSRIHVEDIATAVFASMQAGTATPTSADIFNVCDDFSCAPGDVIAYACALLNHPVPQPVSMDEAQLSPMGRSFYADNKRVSNQKLKDVLDWQPAFPTYREGLDAIFSSSAFSGAD